MRQAVLLLVPALLAAGLAAPVHAADVARGQQLFQNTRGVTGKAVGNCVNCHANQVALRAMITNRGGKPSDARSVRRILQAALDGAVPGAVNAKAQYRGVLNPKDLDDLAAYLASVKQASLSAPRG